MNGAEEGSAASGGSFQVIPPRYRMRSKVNPGTIPVEKLIESATAALRKTEVQFIERTRRAAEEIRGLLSQPDVNREAVADRAREIRDEAGSYGRQSVTRIAHSLINLVQNPEALDGKRGELAVAHADAIRAAMLHEEGQTARIAAASLDRVSRKILTGKE